MNRILDEMITAFRAIEANEDIIPVAGDDVAMRVLAAWTKTENVWRMPKRARPTFGPSTHHDCWRWITSGWMPDYEGLAEATGLDYSTASDKMRVLIANRLVYPDGTMSKPSTILMVGYAAAKLGLKGDPKKPAKKPDDKKPGDAKGGAN